MTKDNTNTLAGYDRSAALALWVGTAAGILVMGLHPTGSDVVKNAAEGGSNPLVTALHALAMVGEGLLLCGALAIVERLRARFDLAVGGYVFFALSGITIIIAAAASGFVAPATVRDFADADAAARSVILNNLHYTRLLNQTFAEISVLFTSVALVLWSLGALITGAFSRSIAVGGLVLAAAMVVGVGSGHLVLNIHGYLLVVVGTGIWQVMVGNALRRSAAESGNR